MAFRSDLDAVILGALAEGPLHGYAITRLVREHSEGFVKLGEGQLYPALHRLEKKGLVAAEWSPQPGKPPRRVYSLTPIGRMELARRISDWERFMKGINAVLKIPSQ